jgi:OmpA-OmpF porin, OOP family
MSRILLATSAVAALMVAQPSQAQFYVGAAGGLTQTRDFEGLDSGPPDALHQIEFGRGWAAALSAGYKYGFGGRAELEFGYRRSGADSLTGGTGSEDADGNARILTGMLNVLYDFDIGGGFMPYVGAGFGRAQVRLSGIRDPNGANGVIDREYSGTDSLWAYQLIAGLAYSVTPSVALTADYRYLAGLGNLKYDGIGQAGGAAGSVGDADLRNHSVMLGLRYSFGGPAPMAAAPVVTPPPAPVPTPPPAVVRQTQTFLVFFDWDSADLTAAARDTVTTAVNAIRAGGNARIEVVGHTDTSGSPQYNQRLGQRRADAVRGEMTRQGLPAGIISTRSAGEAQLRVPTADNVREAQNRRAEIILPPS